MRLAIVPVAVSLALTVFPSWSAGQTAPVGGGAVRLAAQCRYADGTKASITRRPDYTDYFVSYRHADNQSEVVKVDFSEKVARFYAAAEETNGKVRFDLITDPSDVIAFGRVFAYLLTQPVTSISSREFDAFDAKKDVPPCPWKTFEEAPGDVDLKDIKGRAPLAR